METLLSCYEAGRLPFQKGVPLAERIASVSERLTALFPPGQQPEF